jgi:hypothetical protein
LVIVTAQGAWWVELSDAPGAPYAVELLAIAGCVIVVLEASYGPQGMVKLGHARSYEDPGLPKREHAAVERPCQVD